MHIFIFSPEDVLLVNTKNVVYIEITNVNRLLRGYNCAVGNSLVSVCNVCKCVFVRMSHAQNKKKTPMISRCFYI